MEEEPEDSERGQANRMGRVSVQETCEGRNLMAEARRAGGPRVVCALTSSGHFPEENELG